MRVLRWASRCWTGVLAVVALLFCLSLGLRAVLPLLPFASTPLLVATMPADGALDRAPQQPVTLQFSTPMNPRSVEQALTVIPPTPLSFTWNAEHTILRLAPIAGFTPATRYSVSVGKGALGRWYRALDSAAPATITFQIAPAPEVFSAFPLPGSNNVPRDAALSVSFSRPMVDAERIGTPQLQSIIRFNPPLEAASTWVDATTLLVQPSAPLQPGTRYIAKLDPGLTDVNAIPLDQPFAWIFATAAPAVLTVTPADGATFVAPHAPLVLHVSQLLDQAALVATLAISPTIVGQLTTASLPDATAVVTFTPEVGWAADTRYHITLPPGTLPVTGNVPLEGVNTSFRSAPQPVVTGRFPGSGQLLTAGQAVRLIFNTPVDGVALRAALRFEPLVAEPQITVNGNIAEVSAAFAPATVYTATLASTLTDLNGVALGQPYQLRFQTAPAPPTLVLPEAEGNLVRLPVSERGPLLRRTNLSSLDIKIYPIDDETVVRLLDFTTADWRDFAAERAGLTALRTFSRSFTDTLNLTIDERLILTDTGTLAAGAYYLALRGSDHLRADTLLFVGTTKLTIRTSATNTVVWASDQAGALVAGVNLSLYRDGTLVERGQTDAAGLWRVPTPQPGNTPLVVIGGNGALATTAAPERTAPPPYRAVLLTDAQGYQPGDTVRIGGVVRAVGAALPVGGIAATLAFRSRTTGERIDSVPVRVSAEGVISASLRLPRAAMAGRYVVSLGVGSQLFTRDFDVVRPGQLTEAAIRVPNALLAGTPLTATVSATRDNGLPLAGALVSWTLELEPLAAPDGFSYGSADAAILANLRGAGRLDGHGQLALVLSDTLRAEVPLRYRVAASIARADVAPLQARASGTVFPAAVAVGARLASQIATVGQPFALELMTQNQAGSVGDVTIDIALVRVPAANPAGVRELTQRIRSGPDGRAMATLTPLRAGFYQVVASVTDSAGRSTQATLPLWVTAEGFAGWDAPTTAVLPLIADRPRYQPGDVATLLIPAPIAPSTALVTVRRGDQITADVRPLQAGGVITVPIGLDPLLLVEVLLTGQPNGAPTVAATTLAVAVPSPLQLTLTGSRAASGLAATVVLTTTNGGGELRPATVALDLADPGGTVRMWQPTLRTGASGVLTITVPLPTDAGPLTVRAQAVDEAGNTASAVQTLLISRPLELALELPPALRIGDAVELQATVRNPTDAPQSVELRFAAHGLALFGPLTQTVTLAPAATAVITAAAQVAAGSVGQVSVSAQYGRPPMVTAQASAPIFSPIQAATIRSTLVEQVWRTSFERGGNGPLVLTVMPPAALISDTIATIASQRTRTASDSAALLRLTAPLTDERALAVQTLTEVLRAELPGGGWVWQTGTAADVDLSMFVLESLIAARRSGLPVPEAVVQRTLTVLGSTYGARLAYASALAGQPNAAQIDAASRSPQSLTATELALLLLARPADQGRDQALLDALLARLIRDERGAFVASDDLGGDLAATALVAQAIAHVQPNASMLTELRRFLVAAHGPAGWPSSLIAARAIEALGTSRVATGSYRATLNGSLLASGIISATQRLVVPASQLHATNVLTVTTTGGNLLASIATGEQDVASTSGLRLLREYLDPQTGAALDLAHLRYGQLVRVRVTAIASQSVRYLTIREPIPTGCIVVEIGQTPFASDVHDQVLLRRAALAPGVYQQSYLLQIAAAGRFAAPAPAALNEDGVLLGRGNAAVLVSP